MHSAKKRIAVVGAGIAGLSCAFELQKTGHSVIVFEKEARVGGRMASRVKDGFVFDIGADHLCDLYDEIKNYCAQLGVPWEKMRFLKYGVFRGGEVRSFDQAIGRLAKLRLAIQYFFIKNVPSFLDLNHLAVHDTHNAYDFMSHRVGREVADYFVDSFTSTYQFHRAREISLGAMYGIMRSIQKDKERWHLHRTRGGMQALPDALAKQLEVRTGVEVTGVIGTEVFFENDSERFDAVVLACPAPISLTMLKNPTDKQKYLLSTSAYAATISVAFRVPASKLPNVAVVWVPFVESEKISGYVNEAMKGEELVHDGQTLICAWLHEEFARSIMGKSDEEIFRLAKDELERVCPWVTADDLHNHDLQRWPNAMPKFAQGHLARVAAFMKDGQGENNVYLCGDYLNGPWTEGALRCGQRVARSIIDTMPR